ncbi:MAG: hypothetical protein LUC43_04455, partial [Burkholderiales bacterium]|nr:hypothetical protein [Burkholderiales bacterium]
MDKDERLRTTAENFVEAYLNDNPEFFRNHIDLFCKMVPPRQNKEGTRSVIECQNEVLRASLSVYELKEQDAIEDQEEAEHIRSSHWKNVLTFGETLCSAHDAELLPDLVLQGFLKYFNVQHGVLRLWSLAPEFQDKKFAEPVPPWIRAQISSLPEPYVGENAGTEIAEWTNCKPSETGGVFLTPFFNPQGLAFGFMCLANPTPRP